MHLQRVENCHFGTCTIIRYIVIHFCCVFYSLLFPGGNRSLALSLAVAHISNKTELLQLKLIALK